MGIVRNFIADVKKAYADSPSTVTKHINQIPLMLLYIFSPLMILATAITWFNLRIFIGTIIMLLVTLLTFVALVAIEKRARS